MTVQHFTIYEDFAHDAPPIMNCPGELIEVARYPDEVLDGRGADATIRRRDVVVYLCDACRRNVSLDVAAGVILNDYPSPAAAIRDRLISEDRTP